MYICNCQGITESQIRTAIEAGAGSLERLRGQLGVAADCGGCTLAIEGIIRQSRTREQEQSLPGGETLFYSAA